MAHLQTNRTVVALHDPADRPLGELSDDVVSAFDGDEVGWRFREIEVEAAAGAPANVIDAVVDVLRAAGAGEPDNVPKLVRALGPRALAPGDPDVPSVGKHATARVAFQHAVASSVRRLLLHDPVVRLDAGEEGVHQARVATRRLRSDLRTFRPLLDEAALAPLVDELRWLGGLLGAVRDADVLLRGWARRSTAWRSPTGRPVVCCSSGWRPTASPSSPRSSRRSTAPATSTLTQALVDLALTPPLLDEADGPARDAYPELAGRPWEHLRKRVGQLDDDPTDAELHGVRILAKRARYAAEAAAAVIPAAGRHAEAIARLQGVLGDHQDAVVAEQWLRDAVGAGATGPEAFVAGLLVRDEEALARKYRRRWPDAWAEADRKQLKAWLTP